MTATLSQLELGLWKGFKQQKADRYKSEFDCFFDFSQERLEYWSDLADESRVMAFQQGAASAAPVAKPTGGNGGNSHKPRRDDRRDSHDNHKSSNHQSLTKNFHKFQAHSAAAHSHGTQQQPQKSDNADSISNANPNNNFSNRYARDFKCPIPGCDDSRPHARRQCNMFLSLSVGARWDIVKGKKWCPWCMAHPADRDCYAIRRLEQDNQKAESGEDSCKLPHHPVLHHVQGNVYSHRLEVVDGPVEDPANTNVLSIKSKYYDNYLIPQIDVVTVGGLTAVVQNDSGSQTSSVSASFAMQQGIQCRMCDMIVDDGLSQTGTRVTEVHELPIKSLSGIEIRKFFELSVIGTGSPVEDISTNLKTVFFPGCESRE